MNSRASAALEIVPSGQLPLGRDASAQRHVPAPRLALLEIARDMRQLEPVQAGDGDGRLGKSA